MSRLLERRRARDESGFTLIEIMVALVLLAIAATALVPLLVSSSAAAARARLNTQAKNLAQQRIESMRDLQFHVDRQNGPYVDLLDIYYTNLATTASTRTRGAITAPGQNETQSVQWVSGGASSPEPSGAFYRVTVNQVPSYTKFKQVIDTQFLNQDGTAVPASKFTGYDSQTQGKDQPPTLFVGVTVITSWTDHGVSKSYSTYTRIADGRGLTSTISSQAIGELLQVKATGPAGNALTVDLNRSEADGAQSTGSSATADAKAFQAVDAAGGTIPSGATGLATSPGSTTTNTPVSATGASTCAWANAGRTQVSSVTASTSTTTTNGLPQVPADLSTAPTDAVTSSLTANAGGSCKAFWFNNQSTSYDPKLRLTDGGPLITIPDTTSGNAAVTNGAAWVNASDGSTLPHTVSSGASASMVAGSSAQLQLFPGLPYVTSTSSTGGQGLVNIILNSASLSCTSTVPSGGGTTTNTATGSYSVTLQYWKATNTSGGGAYQSQTLTWSSSSNSGSTDPLSQLNPASIVVYQNAATNTTLYLSDYIGSWSTTRSLVETTNSGLHQLPGVLNLTTAQVRTGDPTSTVGLQLGSLSCAAEDDR